MVVPYMQSSKEQHASLAYLSYMNNLLPPIRLYSAGHNHRFVHIAAKTLGPMSP